MYDIVWIINLRKTVYVYKYRSYLHYLKKIYSLLLHTAQSIAEMKLF